MESIEIRENPPVKETVCTMSTQYPKVFHSDVETYLARYREAQCRLCLPEVEETRWGISLATSTRRKVLRSTMNHVSKLDGYALGFKDPHFLAHAQSFGYDVICGLAFLEPNLGLSVLRYKKSLAKQLYESISPSAHYPNLLKHWLSTAYFDLDRIQCPACNSGK